MDDYLRKLAEAPLANPLKINADLPNLNGGRPFPAPREKRVNNGGRDGHLTNAEVRAMKEKAQAEKLETLFAYYATTDKDAATVAQHMGLYKKVQTGADEETGKPTYERVLDVERAAEQLKWRRARA